MSDGGRERASLGVEVWKSSQKWSVQRSAVRSITWLDDFVVSHVIACGSETATSGHYSEQRNPRRHENVRS